MMDGARSYAAKNRVNGWLTAGAATVICDVAGQLSTKGRPACEIGVHHGKLAILLALLTRGRFVGYDLFSMQEQNIDKSGSGNRDKFLSNCTQYLGEGADVLAREMNSMELTPEIVRDDCGAPPVLFSVDGGHTTEITVNDLEVAAGAVAEDGIVILDDFYNEAWPEVAFGATQFLYENPGALHPFCVTAGKVLLARDADLGERLARYLLQQSPKQYPGIYYIGECHIHGRPVCQMRSATGRKLMIGRFTGGAFWQRFKHTGPGKTIRRLLRP